ncbi:MAG TPA: putative porin [Candidatus Acidoferrum sp.]|nr:putative porin [Candidatus Acidoferrum sp.]
MAATAASLALASSAAAQVSADALLDKLVAKGILTQKEAEDLKNEPVTNKPEGSKFKLSSTIKSVELFGDLRMRYEYRSAQLGPEAGAYAGGYDAADRWRYALRIGVRGDLTNDLYYGLRLETGQNERSTWNTLGSIGTSPYNGPFSKSSYTLYIGQAYLGWRPTSWLDVSIGRVPQPLYTTPMVWDSDYTPEGAVEKLKYTRGPVDYFATLGQYVYQDTTPANAYAVQGGSAAGINLGTFSDNNAYLLAWQLGAVYHVDTNLSVKVAPVFYSYVGHGNASAGYYGPFVGQGIHGFTFDPVFAGGTTSSTLPGGFGSTVSYNQTGINNLSIIELPMEVNFKIGSLNARAFGDFSINLDGDNRARAAYNAGQAISLGTAFPGGVQLNQDQAMQFGLAVGNNLDLVYGSKPKKGTWEARAYWQHVEQYALDPNLLDSDFFEGRGNLQGFYAAFAYSFTDAIIGTVRYGWAERIDNQLGTGGYNADLPLPNPVNKFQLLQLDATWKF